MNFIRNAAERVQRGDLTEIYEEIRWMYQYIKKYRLWIFFYVAVGSLGVVMSLGKFRCLKISDRCSNGAAYF